MTLKFTWQGALLLMVIATLAACGGGGGDASSSGTPKAWGIAIPIEFDTGYAGSPQIAVNASGNAMVVWVQSDSTSINIWSTRYIAGYGLDTPSRISNGTSNAGRPQIAIEANGNALALWQQGANVWANRYTVGYGWGIAAIIDSAGGSALASPQLAFDSSGNALAVWTMNNGLRDSIRAIRYTAGSGWGTAEFLKSDVASNNYTPKIVVDRSGNALAMWQQSVSETGGTRYYTWYSRYTVGTGWGIAEKLKTNFTGNTSNPQLAFDNGGNAMAVWTQTDTDITSSGTKTNIWASRYAVDTGWWSAAELIETSDISANSYQIAVDGNGNALATWSTIDGVRADIWANRYNSGTGWGTAMLLENDDTGSAINPQIAFDASGNALAVWQQSDGTIYNIASKRYAAATNAWGTATLIETDNVGNANFPQIAFDANDNAMAVWDQFDGTRNNIWANRFQ